MKWLIRSQSNTWICYFANSSKNKISHVRVLKCKSVRSHWPLEEELGNSLVSQMLLVSEQTGEVLHVQLDKCLHVYKIKTIKKSQLSKGNKLLYCFSPQHLCGLTSAILFYCWGKWIHMYPKLSVELKREIKRRVHQEQSGSQLRFHALSAVFH